MTNKVVVPARPLLNLSILSLLLTFCFTTPAQTNALSGSAPATAESDPTFDPVEFFKRHIFPYEPIYFIAGSEDPNAKFQFGFRYQIADTDSKWVNGFNFAYTQTSLWDLSSPSSPFFDSSYKPELLYAYESILGGAKTNWYRLDLQGGVQHESNGKSGVDSRSLNIAYFRPTLVLGYPDSLHFTLQPRFWGYLGDLSDNPDIDQYRGFFDLRAMLTWKDLQLSVIGRMGKEDYRENTSAQIDLTYRIPKTGIYLDLQYFTGYGESLLRYNERTDIIRFGIALYR